MTAAASKKPAKSAAAPVVAGEADTTLPVFEVRATSGRAPYTRGGVHFPSTRDAVVLPADIGPAQVRRLADDPIIALTMIHVASGRSAVLTADDLFDADGAPNAARMVEITEGLLTASADQGENA